MSVAAILALTLAATAGPRPATSLAAWPRGDRLTLTVNPEVEPTEDGKWEYAYGLDLAAVSEQALSTFHVILPDPDAVVWEWTEVVREPDPVWDALGVPRRMRNFEAERSAGWHAEPEGWYFGVNERSGDTAKAIWITPRPGYLAPGHAATLWVTSDRPPSIVTCYVEGVHQHIIPRDACKLLALDNCDDPSTEEVARRVRAHLGGSYAGYDDATPYGPGMVLRTLGPSPAIATPLAAVQRMRADLAEAVTLGWLGASRQRTMDESLAAVEATLTTRASADVLRGLRPLVAKWTRPEAPGVSPPARALIQGGLASLERTLDAVPGARVDGHVP